MVDRLLRAGRGPGPVEALAALAVLAAIAAAAYGAHVADGGFYSDDWANASGYQFADSPRYWSSVGELEETLGGRPLSAVLLPIPHAIFGLDAGLHLALAAFLALLTSLLFFVLLRTLEMAPLHAGAIAALAMLFPWSDSIHLWPAGSINTISVCLLLLGLIVALRGFDRRGRTAIAMHGAAALLLGLSVLAYEGTGAAALLAGSLYLGRGSRAAALRSWAADVFVVLCALAYSLSTTVAERPVGSPLARLEDAGDFTRESLLLLASAVEPFGSPGRAVQAVVLLLAAAALVAAIVRLRRRADPELAGWLRWAAIGAATVAAAYFMFLGSNLHPRDPGIGNRINVLAGLGYCLLVYALLACACRLLPASARVAAVAAVAVAALVGAGYGIRLGEDESAWRDAANRQAQVVDAIERGAAPLPRQSSLLSFGFPSQTAPGVPLFNRDWDLSGALRLRLDDETLDAYPVYEGIDVLCGRRLVVDGGGGFGVFHLDYGRVFFFEPTRGRERIGSRAACERALGRFRPGRLEA